MPLPESFAKDGLGTNVYFSNCPEELYFLEVKAKLPGWSKRGGINITNLRNRRVTTQLNKTLAESKNMSIVAQVSTRRAYAFDAASLNAWIGFNQLIYFRSPPNLDGNRALYRGYGWCDTLEDQEFSEGELPLWDMDIIMSNTTPAGVEYPVEFVQFVV